MTTIYDHNIRLILYDSSQMIHTKDLEKKFCMASTRNHHLIRY